ECRATATCRDRAELRGHCAGRSKVGSRCHGRCRRTRPRFGGCGVATPDTEAVNHRNEIAGAKDDAHRPRQHPAPTTPEESVTLPEQGIADAPAKAAGLIYAPRASVAEAGPRAD